MSSSLVIGFVTDVRHADKDEHRSDGSVRRHWLGLAVLEASVHRFDENGVQIVVNLGNVADSSPGVRGEASSNMMGALKVFDTCKAPTRIDVIGNHDLINFPRDQLHRSGLCCFASTGNLYRFERLGDGWDAVVLYDYDIGVVGLNRADKAFQEAEQILHTRNRNIKLHRDDWYANLPEADHRFTPVNGAVSDTQLCWLDSALRKSAEAGNKVLVFTHTPIFAGAAKQKALMWNCEEVLEVLHKHRDTVVAVFAGHNQDGGYARDSAGIHHITLGAVFTSKDKECCAILECYDGWAMCSAYGEACGGHRQLLLAKGTDAVN
mmetsp:Transcript_22807/g.65770  ORF Transcript_22807/g.65770 Transcript_22807/m.65770 type:complete len:321 (-) Transcript_22807:389-1351(-)